MEPTRMQKLTRQLLIAVGVGLMLPGLAACKGIFEDDEDDSFGGGNTVDGQFVDSPVAGLGYRADDDDDDRLTDSNGIFEYQDGDEVSFFHGNTSLGRAPGQPFVTPNDLDVCDDTSETTRQECIINIARFLLTHKDDGASTIQLDEGARDDAGILSPVNFDVDPELFGTVNDTENPGLQNYLAMNAGEGRSGLASVQEAETHLNCSEEDIEAGREPDGVCDGAANGGDGDGDGDGGGGSGSGTANPLSPAALCVIPTLGPALVEAVGETCEGGGGDTPLSPEALCAVPVLGPLLVEGIGSSCGGAGS